jgi:hypothetical protein
MPNSKRSEKESKLRHYPRRNSRDFRPHRDMLGLPRFPKGLKSQDRYSVMQYRRFLCF